MRGKLICLFSFVLVLSLVGKTFPADDPSLVIYYDFEGFGNNLLVLDKSGKGNDATVVREQAEPTEESGRGVAPSQPD